MSLHDLRAVRIMNRTRIFVAVVLALCSAALHADQLYQELHDEAWQPVEAEDQPGQSDAATELDANNLTLDALIAEVRRQNPTVTAALNAWRAALAEYPQQKALEDPMLSYDVAPLAIRDPDVRQGHVVELSQTFPWPGKRRLRGEMALEEAEAARLDLQTVQERLILETKIAYYEYWYVHQALEINAINQELLEDFQETAESKYAAGVATKQDALQAEVEREHLVHQEVVLKRMRNVTRARINTLLNRPPASDLPLPPEHISRPIPLPELEALQQAAATNRPELQALASRRQARDIAVDLAHKEFRPDFSVMGRYNSMWGEEEHRFMVGAAVNLPVQLGKRRAAVDEARANARGLEAELLAQHAAVAFAVHEAYEVLEENRHVVTLYDERLVPAAEENLEAAEAGYASGDVDFLALIAAQKLLMDTELGFQQALASYHQSKSELERAIAGPVEPLIALAE